MVKIYLILFAMVCLISCTVKLVEEEKNICSDTLAIVPQIDTRGLDTIFVANDVVITTDSLYISQVLNNIFHDLPDDHISDSFEIVMDSTLRVLRVNLNHEYFKYNSIGDTTVMLEENKYLKKYACKLKDISKKWEFKFIDNLDTVAHTPAFDNGMTIYNVRGFSQTKSNSFYHCARLSFSVKNGKVSFTVVKKSELEMLFNHSHFPFLK